MATSHSKLGAAELSSPRTTEATSAMAMTLRRPIPSEMIAQGVTASARPRVAAETVSAASEEDTSKYPAMAGSSPCTAYSWEKVATPPAKSASSIPR